MKLHLPQVHGVFRAHRNPCLLRNGNSSRETECKVHRLPRSQAARPMPIQKPICPRGEVKFPLVDSPMQELGARVLEEQAATGRRQGTSFRKDQGPAQQGHLQLLAPAKAINEAQAHLSGNEKSRHAPSVWIVGAHRQQRGGTDVVVDDHTKPPCQTDPIGLVQKVARSSLHQEHPPQRHGRVVREAAAGVEAVRQGQESGDVTGIVPIRGDL